MQKSQPSAIILISPQRPVRKSKRAKEQTLEVVLGRAKIRGTPVPPADVGSSGLIVDGVCRWSAKSAVSGTLDASAIPVIRWDTLIAGNRNGGWTSMQLASMGAWEKWMDC